MIRADLDAESTSTIRARKAQWSRGRRNAGLQRRETLADRQSGEQFIHFTGGISETLRGEANSTEHGGVDVVERNV